MKTSTLPSLVGGIAGVPDTDVSSPLVSPGGISSREASGTYFLSMYDEKNLRIVSTGVI